MFIAGISLVSGAMAWLFTTLIVNSMFGDVYSPSAMMVILIIALMVVIAGVVLMIVGWSNHKAQAEQDAAKNAALQRHCRYCNIDVWQGSTHCPVCGRLL
ncbi:MAG: hypothetical protein IJU16_01575 [Clostridia bacterium]|nr:hypothetical protein [Clostridia bacterium]